MCLGLVAIQGIVYKLPHSHTSHSTTASLGLVLDLANFRTSVLIRTYDTH